MIDKSLEQLKMEFDEAEKAYVQTDDISEWENLEKFMNAKDAYQDALDKLKN